MAEQKYAKFVSSGNKVTLVGAPQSDFVSNQKVTIIGSGESGRLIEFLLTSTRYIHPSVPTGAANLAMLFSIFGTDWFDIFIKKFLDNPKFDSGDIVLWSGYLSRLNDSRMERIIEYINVRAQAAVVKLQQNLGEKEDEKTIEDAINGSKNRGREPFSTLSAVNLSRTSWAVIADKLGKGYSVRDLAVNEAKSDSRTSGLIHDVLQAALGVNGVDVSKSKVIKILEGGVVSPSGVEKGTKPKVAVKAKVKSPSKAAAEEENNNSIYDTILRGLMPLFFFEGEQKAPPGRWEDESIEITISAAKAKLAETLNGARPTSDNVEKSSASSLEKLVPLIDAIMDARKNPNVRNVELVGKLIKSKFLSSEKYNHFTMEARRSREKDGKPESAAEVPAKKAGGKLELRPWQSKFVKVITQGQSIIIRGPTSGGKTFASMVALFEVFEQGRGKSLVYVVPAYYQALQVYTNIIKTFPNKKIGLITGTVNVTPKECQAWVGTPIELWTYVSSTQIEGVKNAKSGVKKTMPMTFDIGIFDEIHTISTSYGSGAEAEMRSEALMKLISLIREQFIGLSATIHSEDVKRLSDTVETLIEKGLAIEGSERAPVKLEPSTNYAERPVELKTYNWDGVKYDEFKMGQELVLKEIPITGANTFKLLKALDSNEVSPTLIFDMKESDSYTYFNELVDYLLKLYNKEYSNWDRVKNTLETPIRQFNLTASAASEAKSEIERVQNSESAEKSSKRGKSENKNKGGKSLAADLKQVDDCRKSRETLVRSIKDQIISAIRKSEGLEPVKMADASFIEDEDEDDELELPGAPEEKSDELKLPKLASVLFAKKAKPADKGIKTRADQPRLNIAMLTEKQLKVLKPIMNELPKSVSYETKDLLDEYIKVESSGSGIDPLPYICESRGSYLNFSQNYYDKIFSEMINPNRNDPNSVTEFNFMVDLTEAEGARSSDIRRIFNLMDVALTFGIGMLLPDMLFAVQDKILGLLNKGKMGVVFVSKGMSMGVNYPARSCVIRCPHLTEINVCEALQMQGRAGRWGLIKDKFALAISWNVRNASSISAEMMPHIEYPRDVKLREVGVLVKDPEAAVVELARSMVFSKNRDALKEVSDSLAQIEAKINLPKQRAKNAGLEKAGRSAAADFEDDAQEDEHFSLSVRPSRAEAGAGIDHSQLIDNVVFTALNIAKDSLRLDGMQLALLNSHILAVYEGHDMSSHRDRSEIYTTVEQLNVVKQVLQEIHTIYHEFDCKDLLEHIADLFRIIHRVSMKNLGSAYRN